MYSYPELRLAGLCEKTPFPNPRGADRGAHSLNDISV